MDHNQLNTEITNPFRYKLVNEYIHYKFDE